MCEREESQNDVDKIWMEHFKLTDQKKTKKPWKRDLN